MVSVFLAGSRKFYRDVEQAQATFRAAGVRAETAGKPAGGTDTPDSEKAALLRAFEWIERADAVYVVAPDGYTGRTVCMEIAYAWARGKPVYSSAELEELSARGLVERVGTPREAVRLLKNKV